MVRKSRTESGAQLSSVPLRGSQGTGFAGTAHEGCQAQTWSQGRSEAPRRAPWSESGVTRSPSEEAATRVPVKRKFRWARRRGSEAP